MASIWVRITNWYKRGNTVIRLILINSAIFLVIRLVYAILGLAGTDGSSVLEYLQLPSNFMLFLAKPWTALTYMFVHFGFMHVLMNMFLLYFFGSFFLRWFSGNQLLIQYIFGGLSGALFFLLGYGLFPELGSSVNPAPLIGASASVMAVCVAVTVFRPDEQIPLFMLGTVRLKYLTLTLIVLDMLSFDKGSAGTGLAHLGGALYGMVYGLSVKGGVDFTLWVGRLIQWFSDSFSHKNVRKVKYRRSSNEQTSVAHDIDQQYRNRRKAESDQIDAILDKIKQSGYDSLSSDEKKKLFDSSSRNR